MPGKKKRSRPSKSYIVVREGASTRRPAPPERIERESQTKELPAENHNCADKEK